MIKRGWQLLIALVLIAIVASAGHLIPGLDRSFIETDIRNSLHIIGFAAVAAIVFELVPANLFGKSASAMTFTLVLGLFAEVAQQIDGNRFDGLDIARDAAGAGIYILARLIWSQSVDQALTQRRQALIRTIAILTGSLVFVPWLLLLALQKSYEQRMPVILDFSLTQDIRMLNPVKSNISIEQIGSRSVAKIELLRLGWSGVLIDTVDPDWSAYQFLVIRMAMFGAPGTVVNVELTDTGHPGYRSLHLLGEGPVGPELRDYRFPLKDVRDVPGRPDLDLTNIHLLDVIGDSDGVTATMLIEEIHLE